MTISEAIFALQHAGVHEEALGTLVPARRLRAEVIKPAGHAWRLGGILISRDGTVYETGRVTRAIEPLRGVANKSPDAELRRDKQRAAVRGRFAPGEVVNFDYREVPTPETVNDIPLGDYLAERVALALDLKG